MSALELSPFALSLRRRAGQPVNRTVVFAMLGQSNMVARAAFDSGTVHPAGVLQWGRVAPNDGVLINASVPLEHRDPNTGAQPTPHMGLDITFAQDWLTANPGDTILFVPSADGGTAIHTGFWKKGGAGYNDAIARINTAKAANPGFVFGGFLWHQGESDTNTTGQDYQADLDQMIADMRADISEPNAPFILGELGPAFIASDVATPGAAAINAIILDTPNRVPFTTVASSSSLTQFDTFHFDAASLRTLGQRYAAAVPVAQGRPAAAPDAFNAGQWSLTDAATGGALNLIVTALPDQNGSVMTDIERRVDGGAWVSLGSAETGSFQITGLTDDVEVDVEIRGVNGIGNGATSDTKSATPTTNTAAEAGAIGHWLLGSDNATHTGLIGGNLTEVGAAPTLSSGFLTTADGQAQGLESPFDATDEMTVCVVCETGITGGAVLAGNLGATNGCGLWMFSTPGSLFLRDRDGRNSNVTVESGQAAGNMMFAAFSVSDTGVETGFRGDATASISVTNTAVNRTAHASKIGIGNTRYLSASFENGAQFAELIVFNGHKTVAELEEIYQRSRTRMADRGVAVL